MKHIKYIGFVVLLIFFSCNQNSESTSMGMASTDSVNQQTLDNNSNKVSSERKLIKEGNVEFEVHNLNSSRKLISDAVNKYKGYISSDQEYKSTNRISNTIIIRIPANDFDNLLKEVTKGVSQFDNKEINVKDVTEEFLDIKVRLKTKKELESRFIEILKQAKNVTEILEIERQIGLLRSEIESVEGKMKYLQNNVSFSTLRLTFYESIPNQTEFGGKIKNGFRNGWNNLVWFFIGLINVWPFILLILILIFAIKKYRNKK